MDLDARFWRYVEQGDSCWLWTGPLSHNGYGRFHLTYTKPVRRVPAHRWAYERFVGPIAEGLQIDHLCGTRNCVNPAHLDPVTAVQNIHRSMGVAAKNAVKTHCQQGHDLSNPAVLYVTPDGRRNCRLCRHAATERYKARSAS